MSFLLLFCSLPLPFFHRLPLSCVTSKYWHVLGRCQDLVSTLSTYCPSEISSNPLVWDSIWISGHFKISSQVFKLHLSNCLLHIFFPIHFSSLPSSFLLSYFFNWHLWMHSAVIQVLPLTLLFLSYPSGSRFYHVYTKDLSSVYPLLFILPSAIFCSSSFCLSDYDHNDLLICLLLLLLSIFHPVARVILWKCISNYYNGLLIVLLMMSHFTWARKNP